MDRLFRPAHIASLAFFRICFGFLLIYEVTRYFKYGWIKRNYIDPDYHFSYFGWDWIQPFGGNGMYCLFFVLGFLAFCISIGFLYRISTILFFVGFTYIFLLDKTYYLNHFYLISLISFLLIVIPTHRQYSVDAKLFPSLRTDTLPNWMLYLLTFQIAIPYVYGGIAKINRDWIRGEPMFTWFQSYVADGHLPSIFASSSTALLFSYGGLLFDLLIVPALLWRKTRLVAYIIALCFHLMNAFIFNIGVFPWFMIVATTLFFKPEWCKSLLNRIKSKRIGNKVNHKSNRVVIALVAIYCLIQLLVPLRHFIIPGNVHWTEEGHRFSWHMKLRDKSALSIYFIKDGNGRKERLPIMNYLTNKQALEMASQPDMMHQFGQHMRAIYQQQGISQPTITVASFCSLNGRSKQQFIDPEFNLAAESQYTLPASWIRPMLKDEKKKD